MLVGQLSTFMQIIYVFREHTKFQILSSVCTLFNIPFVNMA